MIFFSFTILCSPNTETFSVRRHVLPIQLQMLLFNFIAVTDEAGDKALANLRKYRCVYDW